MTQIPPSPTFVEPLDRDWPGLTILTVGTDEALRDQTAAAFADRPASVEVQSVETAAAARDRLADVDCVVSRQTLAESTGLDLLATVAADHDTTAFVLCPTAGSESLAAEAINGGADGYVPSDGGTDQCERMADRVEAAVEERRTRERLSETARLLLRLTEYTTDSLWMFTDDWTETTVVNDAYDDVWGRSTADLRDDPTDFMESIHPDDRPMVTAGMEQLSGGEPADVEFRIDADGERRWLGVHAEPVVDADGDTGHVAGFTRDITELKDRELRMESLNESVTALLHARSREEVATVALDIVESVVDCPVSVVRSANRDRERLVALVASESALESTEAAELADMRDVTPGDPMYEVFETGEPRLVEDPETLAAAVPDESVGSLLVVPLGDHGVLEVGTAPGDSLEAFDRQLVELLGRTATAALDRVERDEELEAYREQLERSNESLQQFAYTASHDLQEPLRMVASYVDLLEAEYGDRLDGEAREYMDFAVDGAHRMQDMIDALLQYARVQTRAAEFEETDAERVATETVDSLRMQIAETDATVTVGSLPAVEADPNQLGQVFQNLVENAVTYADESGVDPEVTVEGEADGEMVRFTVADNGPGVDEAAGDVFEIFSRNGTHEADGTGIGLAVCRRIVHRHDGEIWVDSDGEGATFAFTLPAPRPEVVADD